LLRRDGRRESLVSPQRRRACAAARFTPTAFFLAAFLSTALSGTASLAAAKQAEDEEEEVDQVEVQLDGCDDVVVWPEVLEDLVRVVDDVPAEDERADDAVARVPACRVPEEVHAKVQEVAPQDQQNERGEQKGAEEVEVAGAHHREDCQGQEDDHRDAQRDQDLEAEPDKRVDDADIADENRLEESEDEEADVWRGSCS